MAAPSETPSPLEGDEGNNGVEVCLFDESQDEFSRAVCAMSELAASEPEPAFPDTEVERLASSITFLREWRHFSYEPKGVSFTCSTGSASSGHGTHEITLPQFSSASVPKVTQLEDETGNNTDSPDFVLFAGGNVWSLDWCPRLCDKPCSLVNCEYLAVSAHPPGSSYHKLGMPLIGRGIIQVWCVVVPFEEVHPLAYNKNGRRGRPKKIPDGNICSSNPPKPIGRPRKMKSTGSDDHIEPSLKRPRGRPRKYPLSVAKVVDLSENSGSQDPSFIEPLVTSTVIPGDLALARVIPAVESNPRKVRGRPRKIPVDKTKCLSDIELKENMSMALISMKPKKKRGRPRKYPAPSSSKHVMGVDTELERATACPPVSVGCDLGHTGYAESNSNLSDVKVDATLPILSSSSAICEKKSRGRRGGQPKNDTISAALSCSVVSDLESLSMGSRYTISNDTTISVDNSLPAGHSILGSMTSELCSEDSLLPMHIAPKSNGEEPGGRMGRGWRRKKPLLSTTSCVLASGAESTMTMKTASVITSSDNPMALAKIDGEVLASDLDSVGSLRCNMEKCNVHLSAVSSDSRSPAHSLCIANCKEKSSAKRGKGRHAKNPASTECSCCTTFSSERQDIQTTPNPSGNRASVENCKKELIVYTRRGARQPKRQFASNEGCSLALSGEVQNMERSSTCIMPNNQLSSLENSCEAGLIGSKTGVVGCEVIEMNDGNAAYQIVPVSVQNSPQVTDDVEDTEVDLFKESIKNDNNTCAENSNFSPIPKGIHLPRIVLCLAHNGKVAWDIKWKPPLPNQSEQKTRLGFLAILLGNGSLEVWEVPSPSMIQKIYSSSSIEGTDPRFLKLQPVFRCAKVKCGSRQSIPLTVDWSPSPHDMILAGCHDGTVALWKFSTDLPSQDSKPFMCVTAESAPIRALSWAPYLSEEMANTFVTAGEDGLKFWDLRDPYRPLWELTTAPRAVLSLHWLKDARGIVISLEDGTLKFLSLPRIANDVPVTGRTFTGTKTQGVSTYQLSEYLIWNVHVSEITGYAAYCVADGTAVRFHLTSRFWEREPGKNRVPYFLCGSLAEEGTVIKIGGMSQSSLSNVPLVPKRGPKSFQDVDQAHGYVNLEQREGQLDGPDEGQETGALVLADPAMQENVGICNGSAGGSLKDLVIFPPKTVALHRLRWNMNKGSERWLCYGGAAGIIRCQRI